MQDFLISRINSFSLDTQGLTPKNLLERSKREFLHLQHSNTLVICLPSWGQPLWSWKMVKRHVTSSDCSFLSYEFPRPILSNQVGLTRDLFEMINKTVRGDIRKLKEEYGFSQCVIVTLSLSSSFGSMIYKDNPDVTGIVLVAPGEDLARDMWHGCRTQHLRRSYQKQGVQLTELEREWESMASELNMPAPGTRIALYYGKEDKVIPYRFSQRLASKLEKNGFKPLVKTYRFLGHYAVSYWCLLDPSRFLRVLSNF